MSFDEKAQSFRRLSHPRAPSARFCQSLEYSRATATVGEPEQGKEALRIEGIQAHPGFRNHCESDLGSGKTARMAAARKNKPAT